MSHHYDLVVIGAGPAGQKAAVQGAKAGQRVLVVDREPRAGGACVHHGTIPSKTLRETAAALSAFRARSGGVFEVAENEDLRIQSLLARLEQVVRAHERYIGDQLERNGIELWHGRASFVTPTELEIRTVRGDRRLVSTRFVVIATGSRPRTPPDIAVDHENVLDSDSVLSLTYLPRSLAVLGSGVIASEYASVFAALGVKVVMVDKAERPVQFLDADLTKRFVHSFEKAGGRFAGKTSAESVAWDGVESVVTKLSNGEVLRTDKAFVALGRVANVEDLQLSAAGLALGPRGLVPVDEHCRTAVPNVYAAGDVIGPPSLASTSAEQGRRAVCHALGLPVGAPPEFTPVGVYTIPEMAGVGLTEEQARARHGAVVVGMARFDEVARGQISAIEDGALKLVADGDGRKILGVHVVGEGASDLVHLGQLALVAGMEVDTFVDTIFNFPTLAEAYRVAALEIQKRRVRGKRDAA
ncbi:MAG TPA: Si-specific NAD(P)(+) transhydrogenase [Polyangiaceae bacterium]|nr:Si-specific NAD(P)(+) transhydrogenase [Polyangiaceae bacterium]